MSVIKINKSQFRPYSYSQASLQSGSKIITAPGLAADYIGQPFINRCYNYDYLIIVKSISSSDTGIHQYTWNGCQPEVHGESRRLLLFEDPKGDSAENVKLV